MKGLFLLLASSVAVASTWGQRIANDHRPDEPRVIFYQHADYRGDSLVLYPGESIDNFSGKAFSNGNKLNDSVSSIRVEGGAEVYVYSDSRFRGQVLRLTESARDLTGRLLSENQRESWNDLISSAKVETSHRRPGGDRGRAVDYDLVIKRVYKQLMGREPEDVLLRQYRNRMIDQGWTEQMVRDDIQHGEEFRREGADKIIRRAYLDLLGRDVDSSGLKQYRKMLLEKNWTEGDVRDDLRRSTEYKNRAKSP